MNPCNLTLCSYIGEDNKLRSADTRDLETTRMTNPIYGALIYGAPPLLFLATVPLLWTLLSVPIIIFLLPLLLAAVVYKLRRSTRPKIKGIENYTAFNFELKLLITFRD